MSQYGARGRAVAGQTYDEILAHYYTDTTLGTINADQVVRVLLANERVPTASSPARITARGGTWSSQAFKVGDKPMVFAADTYLQVERLADVWVSNVYGPGGVVLATAPVADVTMTPRDTETLFEMKWRDSLPKYDLYRGQMRLLQEADGVTAINSVEMDDYLKGVVPAEMPPLWPFEAVKVQAVTARGYAYVRLKPDNVYDVRPTADNQVYGGYRLEHPKSNMAVEQTSGQVVMYNGVPANTYFFTIAGGATENNELAWVNNVGKVVSNPIPYLRGVPDVDENGLAYDRNSPGFSWASDSFTWPELQRMLALDARTDVGKLLDLRFERGVSGRIYRVTVVGSERTVYISGQALKGIYNTNKLSGATLRSSMFYLERAP
jgi:stage II sporulation protein D